MEEPDLGKNIFLRIAKFGIEHSNGFSYSQLIEDLKPDDNEKKIIDVHIDAADTNGKSARYEARVGIDIDTIFYQIQRDGGPRTEATKYIIEYPAQFSYIDYLELKFARTAAREARFYSTIAIGLSLFALIASVVVPWIISEKTQSVEVTNTFQKMLIDESQVESLIKAFSEEGQ